MSDIVSWWCTCNRHLQSNNFVTGVKIRATSDSKHKDSPVKDLNTSFIFHRYAQLCQNLLEENVESGEQFSKEFLPSLLFLLSDPVPNVRLSLARTLSQGVLLSGTFYFKHSISFGKLSLSSAESP